MEKRCSIPDKARCVPETISAVTGSKWMTAYGAKCLALPESETGHDGPRHQPAQKSERRSFTWTSAYNQPRTRLTDSETFEFSARRTDGEENQPAHRQKH